MQRIIRDKRPEQLKMEFALWNRAAVMQLIERECGITLSVRGVGTYLARWGSRPGSRSRRPTSSVRRGGHFFHGTLSASYAHAIPINGMGCYRRENSNDCFGS